MTYENSAHLEWAAFGHGKAGHHGENDFLAAMAQMRVASHPYSHAHSCGPPCINSGTHCDCANVIFMQAQTDHNAKYLTHPRPMMDMILSQSQTLFSP